MTGRCLEFHSCRGTESTLAKCHRRERARSTATDLHRARHTIWVVLDVGCVLSPAMSRLIVHLPASASFLPPRARCQGYNTGLWHTMQGCKDGHTLRMPILYPPSTLYFIQPGNNASAAGKTAQNACPAVAYAGSWTDAPLPLQVIVASPRRGGCTKRERIVWGSNIEAHGRRHSMSTLPLCAIIPLCVCHFDSCLHSYIYKYFLSCPYLQYFLSRFSFLHPLATSTMKFGIALLAIVPAVLATNLGYKPPKAFMDQHKHCQLPQEYHIVNFVSQTNSTGPSNGTVSEHKTHAAPSAYFFTFIDRDTQTMTNCHYKRSAKTTKSHGGLARYSCDNKDVDFTWHNKDNKLSVFQKVCPDREA